MPLLLNHSPNPQAAMLGRQHLRKVMLGGEVVWQKYRPEPPLTIEDLSLETLEHQGKKLTARNQNGNLYFPMYFPAFKPNSWQWFLDRLTFIGETELSLQTIDGMLEADVINLDMLFPMHFFDVPPPEEYDFRHKCTFIADIPAELGLETIDGLLVADVKNGRDMDFPMVFPEKMPTDRAEFFNKLTFIDKDYAQDFEIEAQDTIDFTKDFTIKVGEDYIKDFIIGAVPTVDYTKTFDLQAVSVGDFTKDFTLPAYSIVEYTKDFQLHAFQRVSYTKDFTIAASLYRKVGILWVHVVDEAMPVYMGLKNLPTTLPQKTDRLLQYAGVIPMVKPHQWYTLPTAEDVRKDIINRIGAASFVEKSLVWSWKGNVYPMPVYPILDVKKDFGEIECLVVVSRGFSWTNTTEPHGPIGVYVLVGSNKYGDGGTGWNLPWNGGVIIQV